MTIKQVLCYAICVLFFLPSLLHAEDLKDKEASKRIEGANLITLAKNETIQYVSFESGKEPSISNIESWLQQYIAGENPYITFIKIREENDELGFTHIIYEQRFQGIKIEHGIFKFHCKEGKVVSANGEYYPTNTKPQEPRNMSWSAVAEKIFQDEYPGIRGVESKQHGVVYVALENKQWILCDRISVEGFNGNPKAYLYYLNNQTGEKVLAVDQIHYTNVLGTAVTNYSGTVSITTDSVAPGSYRLRENGARVINTYNLNGSTSTSSGVDFYDANNIWDTDDAAYDGHFNLEKTWDYYLSAHSRNSYDNLGSAVNSYIHYGSNVVNAFWNPSSLSITFGDGDGVNYGPLTSVDVVGHELTHAVTQFSAALVYSYESGALNESFSDIFGVAVDYYANPTTANFLMGDVFAMGSTPPFRNMSNPNATNQPDTYQGVYWEFGSADNGGVHTNSQVQNYWFYLLCNGGSGMNDNGDPFNISPIGMTKAAKIAYRNLTVYLTSNSQYTDARTYSIQSAIDLYGTCSPEVIAVTNAWHAVGVGSLFTGSVAANFAGAPTYSCGTSMTVTFTNSSTNATSYNWNFGDGGTSTLASPTHTYTTPGVYDVTLIVNGSAACGSTPDTLIMPAYITLTGTPAPIPATCVPISTSLNSSYGITNVKLNTINKTSSTSLEGYKDFTCTDQTNLQSGSQYQLKVTTQNASEYVYAWIDYNNNGTFATSELLPAFSTGSTVKQVIFGIPSSGVVYNTPLRMRIISDLYTVTGACASLYYGQGEDYTVVIGNTTSSAPVANYWVVDTFVNAGTVVNFTDLSTNAPTSWNWTIPGGSPTSSTVQNPTATFNTVGVYPVKLVASNAYGSDSITRNIHVISTFNLCNPSSSQTTTATSGTVYDSGGPLGGYNNYENCSLLISPGSCTDSIKLTFSSFQTESGYDYIYIYDGTSTAGTLLYSGSGYTIPPVTKALSGNMFIRFYTDGSATYAGFAANWVAYQQASTPPVANFTFTPSTPAVLDTVFFTNTTSTNAQSWNWNFGDGGTSTLQNPTHQYATAGTYTVTLIAGSCGGGLDTISYVITTQANPNALITPNFFNVTLGCNDTANLSLFIQNTSGGTLNWNASTTTSGGNQVLAWTYGADLTTEYPNTIAAINQYFTGYVLSTSSATSASVLQNDLNGKNILLIPEKETSNVSIVTACAPVIQNFVNAGGVVIYCGDGYSTTLNTGIFTGSYNTYTNSTTLTINTTSTPLTTGVVPPLISSDATLYYNFTNSNKTEVVSYNGYDVVTYLPYGQGMAIYVGYDFYAYNSNGARIIANAMSWATQLSASTSTITPTSGSLIAGSTDTVAIQVSSTGMQGGLDTSFVVITTNDPLNPVDTIWIYMNISTMPCVNFGYSQLSSCSGMVNFIDSTNNAPTSWLWDFGDGGSSTQQNPSHLYTATGTYTVTLHATNATGTDSISKIVTITNINGPLPTLCVPLVTTTSTTYGIMNVQLNTINKNSSNATEGYKDFTCTDQTTLNSTSQYALNVTTQYISEYVRVFIDYNNDGSFGPLELLPVFPTNVNPKQITLSIPSTGVVYNTPLRMRVISDYTAYSVPCPNLNYGQAEDYTVTITNSSTLPPVANYSVIDTFVNLGSVVNFTDLSTNGPTSWNWTIPGGSPTTSTAQNPTSTFNTLGVYPVKLVASNAFGSDSITKNIHVVNMFKLCSPSSTQTTNLQSGWLFDSGGSTGNYGSYENCSFLISPGACVDSIKLTFNSFQTEAGYDYMYVYDGTSTAGILLYSGSGSTLPPVTKATSGNMFIRFTSNSSVNLAGFAASWFAYIPPVVPPTANFTFTPSSPAVQDTVFFTNTSSANAITWNWNFGDGGTSTLQNPTHVYATAGSYTVTLIAGSCGGGLDTITYVVTTQANPTAVITPAFFNVSLGCNDTANLSLFIQNAGGGTLNWNTTSSGGGGNQVLAWTYGADMTTEYPNTINAINQYFTGYTLTTSAATVPATLQSDLAGKNVLLVPEKENASSTILTACAPVIQNFVNNGGVVIYCGDGSYYTCLSSGIFTGSYTNYISGTAMTINTTTTPLTNNVTAPLYSSNATFYYNFTNASKTEVVSYSGYDAVTIVPYGSGKAIYIGYDYYAYDNNGARIIANAVEWATQISGAGMQTTPNSGSLSAGSTDTVSIQITSSGSSAGGLDTAYVIVNTNDPLNPTDTVWIYINITSLPCVNFGYELTNTCNGIVSFSDSSTHTPTSWYWTFGDGGTSTLQNPTHAYTALGNYTVTLHATNAFGTDSFSQVISVTNLGGPIPTTCNMPTSSTCCGNGISNVNFVSINSSSGNDLEGYKDFTCTYSTTVNKGVTYPYTITGSANYQYYNIYFDVNNDGTFSSSEIFLNNYTISGFTCTGNLTIPANCVTNTPLRLRIVASYYSIPACSSISYGQAEDYSVIVLDSLPNANFMAAPTTVWVNQNVTFTDQSTGNPTSWSWLLPGSSSPTTSVQNPIVNYSAAGNYPATLIVGNGTNFDTLSLTNYIHVLNLPSTSYTYVNPNCAGTINFTAQLPTPYTSGTWDFGDGSAVQTIGSNLVSHTYSIDGAYTVTLIANSPYGTDTFITTVNVSVWNPTLSVTGSALVNTPMNFSVNSTNAISSYSWNFGDGNTSNLSNPSNTYTSVGTYTVSVVVTDHFGCSVTLTYVITINPNAVYSITESDIKVYPNPFSTFIQLDLGSIKGWENMNLRLNNTLGQIIQTWSINNNGTNQFKIDLPEQLAAGIYYLDLKLDDNQYRLKLRKD